jgi:beta-galactosidase
VTDPGYETAAQQQQQRRAVQTLYSDWTPENAAPHDENVEVYSNCDEVELLLNGKSLGLKPLPADASSRNWTVPYAPGKLEAIGRNKGKQVAVYELHAAGNPAKVVLTSSAQSGIVMVLATIVDKDGVPVPNSDALLSFHIQGPGAILATDNADNASHESYQSPERHAYQGRAIAIVKPTGSVEITTTAPGLEAGSVHVSKP